LKQIKKDQDTIQLESDKAMDQQNNFGAKMKELDTEIEGYKDELEFLAEEIQKTENHIIIT